MLIDLAAADRYGEEALNDDYFQWVFVQKAQEKKLTRASNQKVTPHHFNMDRGRYLTRKQELTKKCDILEISNNRQQTTKMRRSVICKCQKSFPPVQVCVTMHKKSKTNQNMIHDPINPSVKWEMQSHCIMSCSTQALYFLEQQTTTNSNSTCWESQRTVIMLKRYKAYKITTAQVANKLKSWLRYGYSGQHITINSIRN